mmetsp:Transcript_33664/g.86281  ORF Transcript_33664/g.86281 Transcript_33664/m.86281 type:complete len:84 (+) Transcript_33664:1678-1929(+)
MYTSTLKIFKKSKSNVKYVFLSNFPSSTHRILHNFHATSIHSSFLQWCLALHQPQRRSDARFLSYQTAIGSPSPKQGAQKQAV